MHVEEYRHQVGGHCKLIKPKDSSKVYKPLIENEYIFYEKLSNFRSTSTDSVPLHILKKFVPKFYGVAEIVIESYDPQEEELREDTKEEQRKEKHQKNSKEPKRWIYKKYIKLDKPIETGTQENAEKVETHKERNEKSEKVEEINSLNYKWLGLHDQEFFDGKKKNLIIKCKDVTLVGNEDSYKEETNDINCLNGNSKVRKRKECVPHIVLEDLVYGFKRPCVLDIKMGKRQRKIGASKEKKKRQVEKSFKTTSHSLGFRLCGCQNYDQISDTLFYKDKYWGRKLSKEKIPWAIRNWFWNGSLLYEELIPLLLEKLHSFFNCIVELRHYRFWSSSLLWVFDGGLKDKTARSNSLDIRMIDFANTIYLQDNPSPDEEYIFGLKNLIESIQILYNSLNHIYFLPYDITTNFYSDNCKTKERSHKITQNKKSRSLNFDNRKKRSKKKVYINCEFLKNRKDMQQVIRIGMKEMMRHVETNNNNNNNNNNNVYNFQKEAKIPQMKNGFLISTHEKATVYPSVENDTDKTGKELCSKKEEIVHDKKPSEKEERNKLQGKMKEQFSMSGEIEENEILKLQTKEIEDSKQKIQEIDLDKLIKRKGIQMEPKEKKIETWRVYERELCSLDFTRLRKVSRTSKKKTKPSVKRISKKITRNTMEQLYKEAMQVITNETIQKILTLILKLKKIKEKKQLGCSNSGSVKSDKMRKLEIMDKVVRTNGTNRRSMEGKPKERNQTPRFTILRKNMNLKKLISHMIPLDMEQKKAEFFFLKHRRFVNVRNIKVFSTHDQKTYLSETENWMNYMNNYKFRMNSYIQKSESYNSDSQMKIFIRKNVREQSRRLKGEMSKSMGQVIYTVPIECFKSVKEIEMFHTWITTPIEYYKKELRKKYKRKKMKQRFLKKLFLLSNAQNNIDNEKDKQEKKIITERTNINRRNPIIQSSCFRKRSKEFVYNSFFHNYEYLNKFVSGSTNKSIEGEYFINHIRNKNLIVPLKEANDNFKCLRKSLSEPTFYKFHHLRYQESQTYKNRIEYNSIIRNRIDKKTKVPMYNQIYGISSNSEYSYYSENSSST